jgi:antitoxin VapB
MTILSHETEVFAARLAAARQMSVDEAVRRALEVWAHAENPPVKGRDISPAAVAERKASIDRIVAEIATLPVLDPRSPQEIMDDLDPL